MLVVVPKVHMLEGRDLCLGDIRVGNMTGKDISQESVYSCLSEMAATGPECEGQQSVAHSGSSLIHSANLLHLTLHWNWTDNTGRMASVPRARQEVCGDGGL